jgi:hypothetical protein
MSKLKNKKNMKNIQKGAEFVSGAIDEAADAVWGLGKFWLKMMMWFMIIGISFVSLESVAMSGAVNSDMIILFGSLAAFTWAGVHLYKVIRKNQREGNYK